METPTWPMCEWDLSTDSPLDIDKVPQTMMDRPCRNAVSRSFRSRRPYYRACEVCLRGSKRLSRFYKTRHRVSSYSYHVFEHGKLKEVVESKRPEDRIIEESRIAGVPYTPEASWRD